jgi:Protein of unknown function (DUF2846)
MRSLTSVLFVLSLASLSATAQVADQPVASQSESAPTKAAVYIYRYKQFAGSALAPSVYGDDIQLARMENGRYFMVRVDPGNHTFRSNDPQSGVAIDLKAGQEYFIRIDIATGLLKGHGRLTLTSVEQGRYELQSNKLKPLDAGKVTDRVHVSVEEANFTAPVPPPAAAPTPPARTQVQTTSTPLVETQRPVNGLTLSDEQVGTDQQMSVGEAARQARQKKAARDAAPTPQ